MFCEECDNSEATFHFTEISDDNQNEFHLCLNCAKNISINANSHDHPLSLTTMLSFLNDDPVESETTAACPDCGLTGVELNWHGRPGCPSCYRHFRTTLGRLVRGNSNSGKYSGKRPESFVEIMSDMPPADFNFKLSKSILELEDELKKAVNEERYETAAVLRDKIREVTAVA
jgi:protein arginine kinase activator